jgi:hypothetical protein
LWCWLSKVTLIYEFEIRTEILFFTHLINKFLGEFDQRLDGTPELCIVILPEPPIDGGKTAPPLLLIDR